MAKDYSITSPLVCITGGIGSGKSVVCRLLQAMGYEVYDCDSRAKALMERSESISNSLSECFSSDIVEITPEGGRKINRPALASIVFSDPEKLARLNAIVHAEVRADILRWAMTNGCGKPLFVETAIAYTSGLAEMVDGVWRVVAPMPLRIERAMSRDNATEQHIRARIASQTADEHPTDLIIRECAIVNDGAHPLIPQITHLLATLQS